VGRYNCVISGRIRWHISEKKRKWGQKKQIVWNSDGRRQIFVQRKRLSNVATRIRPVILQREFWLRVKFLEDALKNFHKTYFYKHFQISILKSANSKYYQKELLLKRISALIYLYLLIIYVMFYIIVKIHIYNFPIQKEKIVSFII
jgi:hypothetical protein